MTTWPASIRALLAARGWTQARLASEIGCSLPAVTRWLSGRRTPTGLYAAAIRRELASAGIASPE